MNILIVEDQRRLADALAAIFAAEGYQVDSAYDGPSGLDYALLGDYDVVILDIMLPGFDGFEVLRQMRKEKRSVPVLMLTARDELSDKVSGLDQGADDYLTKPFEAAELLARVRALSRRTGEVVLNTLQAGQTVLNLDSGDLNCGDSSVHLSFRELELCRLFMSNISHTFPKSQLLDKLWGLDSNADENSVEAYVSFLRKKLDFLESDLHISTIRLLGYRMELTKEA